MIAIEENPLEETTHSWTIKRLIELRDKLISRLNRVNKIIKKREQEAFAELLARQRQDGIKNIHGTLWLNGVKCNGCGSMSTHEAIRLLSMPGTRYSSADWKYGWPHKFYIGEGLFYSEHLNDVDIETISRFNELSRKYFDVTFHYGPGENQNLIFSAPKSAQNRYGITQ